MSTKDLNPQQKVDKTRQAWDLRLSGHTYKEISIALGVSIETAHRWVNEWSEEYRLQTAESQQSARSDSIARLDDALKAISPAVQEGDTDAINTMLKIEAQRAKLLGLDAPTKVEAEVKAEVAVTFTMG